MANLVITESNSNNLQESIGIILRGGSLWGDSVNTLRFPIIIVVLPLDTNDQIDLSLDSAVLCQISDAWFDSLQITFIEQNIPLQDILFFNDAIDLEFDQLFELEDLFYIGDFFEIDFIEQFILAEDVLYFDDFGMPIISFINQIEVLECFLSDSLNLSDYGQAILNLIVTGVTSFPILTQKIKWSTNIVSDSQVKYGTTPQLGNVVSDSTLTLNHSIIITNLLANKNYYYQTISKDSFGNSQISALYTFRT